MKKNGKLILIILLALISYYYVKNIFIPITILLSYLIILICKNNEQNKIKLRIKEKKEYEFSNMLSYLLVFLENNFNVYQALQMSMNFTEDILNNDIDELLSEIDTDKSIIPYQNFANKFNSNLIYQVVMMIYQLDVNGYDARYLDNFPKLISDLRQARIENMIASRKMNMSFMTVIPIIALLMVVFVMVFYILMNVGGIEI